VRRGAGQIDEHDASARLHLQAPSAAVEGHRPHRAARHVRPLPALVIEPGGVSGPDFYTHKGEACGYVIRGALRLRVEEQEYRLGEGDSFRFRSTLPHRFENGAESTTEVLWIVTPPLY